ncbi:50S ribosomal protein L25 [Balneolaceae bacterium ANBcel3]|nr:50S ribosomal protein L25 [Balneolaceae bacterium ANBcel3]
MEKPNVITVEAKERPQGKSALKQLRNDKLVPGVAYGPKVKENLHFAIPELELEKALQSNRTTIIKLVFGGKEYDTLIQSVEYHPVTDRPLHVDLFAMEEKTPVIITIPIRLKGTSPGVTEGGRLYQPLRRIRVQCLPKDIPAEILLDISTLKIGDTIDVDAIDIEGVEPLRASFGTIAVIRPPKGGLAELLGLDEEEEGEEGEATEAADASEGESSGSEEESGS